MRIIKQRLLEMLPDVRVFLDVDDLEEIGDLEGYIDRTTTILVYCSKGYFQSACTITRPLNGERSPLPTVSPPGAKQVRTACASSSPRPPSRSRSSRSSTRTRRAAGSVCTRVHIVARASDTLAVGARALKDVVRASCAAVHVQLLEEEVNFTKWGFDAPTTPAAQALHDHLFANEPIEWNRESACDQTPWCSRA